MNIALIKAATIYKCIRYSLLSPTYHFLHSVVFFSDLAKCVLAAGTCGTDMSWFGRTGSLWWRSGMTGGPGVQEEGETGRRRTLRCYWAWGRSQVMTLFYTDIHSTGSAGQEGQTQLWDHLFIVCSFGFWFYPLLKINNKQNKILHRHTSTQTWLCRGLPPPVCMFHVVPTDTLNGFYLPLFPSIKTPCKTLDLHNCAIWLSQRYWDGTHMLAHSSARALHFVWGLRWEGGQNLKLNWPHSYCPTLNVHWRVVCNWKHFFCLFVSFFKHILF